MEKLKNRLKKDIIFFTSPVWILLSCIGIALLFKSGITEILSIVSTLTEITCGLTPWILILIYHPIRKYKNFKQIWKYISVRGGQDIDIRMDWRNPRYVTYYQVSYTDLGGKQQQTRCQQKTTGSRPYKLTWDPPLVNLFQDKDSILEMLVSERKQKQDMNNWSD